MGSGKLTSANEFTGKNIDWKNARFSRFGVYICLQKLDNKLLADYQYKYDFVLQPNQTRPYIAARPTLVGDAAQQSQFKFTT